MQIVTPAADVDGAARPGSTYHAEAPDKPWLSFPIEPSLEPKPAEEQLCPVYDSLPCLHHLLIRHSHAPPRPTTPFSIFLPPYPDTFLAALRLFLFFVRCRP